MAAYPDALRFVLAVKDAGLWRVGGKGYREWIKRYTPKAFRER